MKTPALYWHESEGNLKIKLKNLSFFNFQKIGSGGSVKRKIKKLWPKGIYLVFVVNFVKFCAINFVLH